MIWPGLVHWPVVALEEPPTGRIAQPEVKEPLDGVAHGGCYALSADLPHRFRLRGYKQLLLHSCGVACALHAAGRE